MKTLHTMDSLEGGVGFNQLVSDVDESDRVFF